MAITYRIDKAAKLIRARVFGEISFDEFRATLREILEDPDFDPSFGRLWTWEPAGPRSCSCRGTE